MKTKLTILISLLFSVAFSQGKPLESFVPKGWKVIAKAEGDLNKDDMPDVAMVIENTDKKNILINSEGLGQDTLNVNPRHLLILIKEGENYYPKTTNKEFIPPQNDAANACLGDPFVAEAESFNIKKGVLSIRFNYWSGCGSYYITNAVLKFRMQEDVFCLIGYDENTISRNMGDVTKTSINLLTGKKSYTSGGNEFKSERNHPKTVWSNFTPKRITLDELGSDGINLDF